MFRYKEGDVFVDTCKVFDGTRPYETAIGHPEYNDGKLVIVQAYSDEKSAEAGHNKWVSAMTNEPLPEVLEDCCNCIIAQFAFGLGGEESNRFPRVRKETHHADVQKFDPEGCWSY